MSDPIVIVGDTVLDRDVEGDVTRFSPDGPAPVLDERHAQERPGGAGLAAVLAAAGGHEVVLVTGLADDAAGARLSALLTAAGVDVYPLALRGTTPEKIRLRSGRHTLMRLDRGGHAPVADLTDAALAVLRRAGAVLVSDYGHGSSRSPALRQALAGVSVPVVWDPHPRGAPAVPGTRLVTPNEAELHRLTGGGAAGHRLAATTRAAHTLRDRWRVASVAVTMGADGALLCNGGPNPLVVAPPAAAPADADTCGAGDRFAVAATAALAGGALVSEAVQDAVARATAYVAAGGAAALPGRPNEPRGTDANAVVARVRAAGGTVVATGGCFDLLHTGHLATLEAARRLGDCLVVLLNSDRSVAELKGPARPLTPQADRAMLLGALGCVDAVVVFDETTPHATLSWLRPDVWVKGGDYSGDGAPALPEADLVRRWGGQTVVVPYLTGRSTTATIAAVRDHKETPV